MAKEMQESTAVRKLSRNGINVSGKDIIANGRNAGIKMWGVIDYLCHYCGYRLTLPVL